MTDEQQTELTKPARGRRLACAFNVCVALLLVALLVGYACYLQVREGTAAVVTAIPLA